jgi:thiol-disulfide isomerase/thioredoxin
MPDIVDADKVSEEGKTTVKHEKGQVILYDFWATWCGPCQQPMEHNQHMLETRGADWGDKVRIIGLSLDNEMAALKNHIEAKKWEKIEHYQISNGVCQADEDHGIRGIPHVLLVDIQGVIVYKGHPASRNLEQDIDALLKGEKITGKGTEPAAKSSAKEEESVNISEVGITAAKDLFKMQAK